MSDCNRKFETAGNSRRMAGFLRKNRAYGDRIGKPLIPIGVRGFTKGTISQICDHFNNLINADYNDFLSDYEYGIGNTELVRKFANGDKRVDLNRFLLLRV